MTPEVVDRSKAFCVFRLPYVLVRRRHWVVAHCPILDISSQGETAAKAKAALTEATRLFVMSCYQRGVLDQVLKECGFAGKAVRKVTPKRKLELTLPIPASYLEQCHA